MPIKDPDKRREYEKKRSKDPLRIANCRMRYYRDIKQRKEYELSRSRTEARKQYARDLRQKNLEHYRQKDRENYVRNKDKHLEIVMRRYHHKGKATPKWLTKEHKLQLRLIYKNRPSGHHVDHIVPIQGRDVCGLHVPWNLQYLPASENIKKGNKL